ncbi:Alpha/Beta hydrolase protein [Coniella lustricola]|uniref:Alpha/Beta hydrolase protein n=1 Tax=Coniella lustricola TaxID=2025994 RepID=A0A2T3A4Z8_9PEZI|nr:Alpha/Beta hydrolase protein [Coniella lustricola]
MTSTSRKSSCSEVRIPLTISESRFDINATVRDNWDAVSLTFNLTSRVFNTPDDPLPIAGGLGEKVTSNYTVAASLCGTGSTMIITTHGIIESRRYFQPNLSDSAQYSFVDAAVAAGYSVLNYDRIGVGESSTINSSTDAQFQVEVNVLNALVTYARETAHAEKVVLLGHSYGAYISALSAAATTSAVDALVLTGFSGTLQYFAPFASGAGFRVARLQDPARWGHLDSGYLTTSDVYALTYVGFADPYFEKRMAEWTFAVACEPFGVGELPTLLATPWAFGNVTAPTLVLQGRYDVSACGGDCVGVLDTLAEDFTAATVLETVDDLPAGHDLFLHTIAPQVFDTIFGFLSEQNV